MVARGRPRVRSEVSWFSVMAPPLTSRKIVHQVVHDPLHWHPVSFSLPSCE
ncbi:hypothetical protein ACFFX0_02740 [Citricoccus parietis]|uniref:Uncharacterized protein n=1 Tax=Citricoccus parietis TaxID=592307 RepID=A0ABV5FU52_9MICC